MSIITPPFAGVAEEKHDVPAALIVIGRESSQHILISRDKLSVSAGLTIMLAR
jgi:hypothetical protein